MTNYERAMFFIKSGTAPKFLFDEKNRIINVIKLLEGTPWYKDFNIEDFISDKFKKYISKFDDNYRKKVLEALYYDCHKVYSYEIMCNVNLDKEVEFH